MTRYCIATSFYDAARPFAEAWTEGVMAATRGRGDVAAIIVAHGAEEADKAFAALARNLPTRHVPVSAAASIAAVRARMLDEAWGSGADAVVFCDADDALTPQTLDLHAAALESADISVGDLVLVDAQGRRTGALQFGSTLPPFITAEAMADVNFCGFSNTAVRRGALAKVVGAPIPDVVAVDWWVFSSMLAAGCTARRTDAPVAFYRQHDANTLGSGSAVDVADAARRLAIVAQHHRAAGRADKAQCLEALAARPERLAAVLAADSPKPGPWHANVARWHALALEIV